MHPYDTYHGIPLYTYNALQESKVFKMKLFNEKSLTGVIGKVTRVNPPPLIIRSLNGHVCRLLRQVPPLLWLINWRGGGKSQESRIIFTLATGTKNCKLSVKSDQLQSFNSQPFIIFFHNIQFYHQYKQPVYSLFLQAYNAQESKVFKMKLFYVKSLTGIIDQRQ